MKNSPLDWSINLLLFVVMEFMPQECAVQVWGLEFMEGEGGRRWQVRRGITFQLKKSRYSPLERGIDLNLFYWSLYRCCGRVRCGGVGFVICKGGWQKMVSQGWQVPIKSLTK